MDIKYWQNARKKLDSCDVKLIATGNYDLNPSLTPISAHKKFLEKRSPYFQTLKKWTLSEVILIPGITTDILSRLIDYLYSSSLPAIDITVSNALDIWLGANTLMLEEVKRECDLLIVLMPITIENCSQMLIRACMMKSMTSMMDSCLLYMLLFLNEFIDRPEFLILNCNVLQEIIKRGLTISGCNYPSELLQMIVNWVNFGGKGRLDAFITLLVSIPSHTLDQNDIANIILKGLRCELKTLFLEKLHARKNQSSSFSPMNTNSMSGSLPLPIMDIRPEPVDINNNNGDPNEWTSFPSCSESQSTIVPGPSSSKKICISNSVPSSASPISNSWDITSNQKFDVGGVIYFITGSPEGSTGFQLVSYSLTTFGQLTLDTSEFLGKKGASLVYHDRFIYIIGGAASIIDVELDNGMLIYDLKTRNWRTDNDLQSPPVPKMLDPRYLFNCAILNDEIYAVAGCQRRKWGKKGSIDININCVEKLKPTSACQEGEQWSWEYVDFLTKARSDCGVAAINGKIFAVGGHLSHNQGPTTTVEVYDPTNDKWIKKASLKKPLMGLCAVTVEVNDDGSTLLYALGGGDTPAGKPGHMFNTVQIYDPSKNLWQYGPPMNKARQYGSAVFYQNCIYAIGGDSDEEPTMETLKIGDDEWTMIGDLPRDGTYRSIAFQP